MKIRITVILAIIIIAFISCNNKENKFDDEIRLGIFGGMGPEATADLYKQVIKLTPAEKDQDHIPTLMYSMTQIPDRMSSIRNKDMKVIPYIVDGLKRLENAGASFIAVPCNTVHYFYEQMQEAVSIPIIHMIKETVQEVNKKYPDLRKIGLLATTATIETKLYENELLKEGYEVVVCDDQIENDYVMKAIFGIKAGIDKQINEDLLAVAGQNVIDKGAEVIILGCTEIPMAFNPDRVNVPVINATKILAERAIQMYQEFNDKKGDK